MGRLWCMKSEPAGEQKSNTTAQRKLFLVGRLELEEPGIREPLLSPLPPRPSLPVGKVLGCQCGLWGLGFSFGLRPKLRGL